MDVQFRSKRRLNRKGGETALYLDVTGTYAKVGTLLLERGNFDDLALSPEVRVAQRIKSRADGTGLRCPSLQRNHGGSLARPGW